MRRLAAVAIVLLSCGPTHVAWPPVPGEGGSGGEEASGGSGGGPAGCPGPAPRCGRALDCDCVPATCDASRAWLCPSGYPLDHCPVGDECGDPWVIDVPDCSTPRMPGGKYRRLGDCCDRETDCAPGLTCRGGWCTRSCLSDGDCAARIGGPSPFALGTRMRCGGGWCIPGSGAPCTSPHDCPGHESCSPTSNGPLCLAAILTPNAVEPGEACDPADPYGCRVAAMPPATSACVDGLCSAGCDPATPDACGDGLSCVRGRCRQP